VLGEVAVSRASTSRGVLLNAAGLTFGFSATPGTPSCCWADPVAARAAETVALQVVALLNRSRWWHVVGVLFIVGVLAFVPGTTSRRVRVRALREQTGWASTIYVAALGLLLAQYTFTATTPPRT